MEVKEHVIRSCRYLLLPVVRFLLKHGVTWSEFGELSKEAYVQVARDDYGIQGRPTNNSRVAMMTGLSRREVAKVRDRLLDGLKTATDGSRSNGAAYIDVIELESSEIDPNPRAYEPDIISSVHSMSKL